MAIIPKMMFIAVERSTCPLPFVVPGAGEAVVRLDTLSIVVVVLLNWRKHEMEPLQATVRNADIVNVK